MADLLPPPSEAEAPIANLEAEQVILSALLIDSRLIDRLADKLSADDFSEPVFRRLFDLIVTLHSRGEAVNGVTLLPHVKDDEGVKALGGQGFIARLTSNPTATLGALGMAKQVAQLARYRRLDEALGQAQADVAGADRDLPQIVDDLDEALHAATRTREAVTELSAGDCAAEVFAEHERGVSGVSSGISPLDSLLGPLRAKSLTVVGGRPGMGKSAAALSYATGAAREGHGVLFVSLEMSSVELGQRMLAAETYRAGHGVPFSVVRDGNVRAGEQELLQEAHRELGRLPLTIVDIGALSTGQLSSLVRRHARRLSAKGQSLDLVVVDYLQLLRPSVKTSGSYEAASEVSRALKGMAKEHGVAIMALAQLNRQVESRFDKRPMQSDLRDSGQIEQDADAILFLYRHEYYLAKDEPNESSPDRAEWVASIEKCRGSIDFILAKRRNGPPGSSRGSFSGVYQAVTA